MDIVQPPQIAYRDSSNVIVKDSMSTLEEVTNAIRATI